MSNEHETTPNEVPLSDLLGQLRQAATDSTWPAPHLASASLYAIAADEIERLRELRGARPDENITAMTERLIRERDALREVAARMVAGIDHLDKLTREWEPDHSSGADRRGWLLAKDARDDAARLLGPNDQG